jgi:hypothetical protein
MYVMYDSCKNNRVLVHEGELNVTFFAGFLLSCHFFLLLENNLRVH